MRPFWEELIFFFCQIIFFLRKLRFDRLNITFLSLSSKRRFYTLKAHFSSSSSWYLELGLSSFYSYFSETWNTVDRLNERVLAQLQQKMHWKEIKLHKQFLHASYQLCMTPFHRMVFYPSSPCHSQPEFHPKIIN